MSDDQQSDDVERLMAVVDGVMGAAGHRLDGATDPYGRHLLELVARGELTADEAVALSRQDRPYYNPVVDPEYLDAYINRLVQYMGPTPMATKRPDSVAFKMATKRHHRRDDEISTINPAWMTPRARACLLRHLERTLRLEQALKDYPNLAGIIPPQLDGPEYEPPEDFLPGWEEERRAIWRGPRFPSDNDIAELTYLPPAE